MATTKKTDKNSTLFDKLTENQKDFFLISLEKKVRNISKKLKEIKQLETDRKEGKELKDAQIAKIAAKADHQSKIKEQEAIAKVYLEARAEQAADSGAAAPVVATVQSIAQLYFASQLAHQTNTVPELSSVFSTVFLNQSASRVDEATARLVAYVSGELSALSAQVAEILAAPAVETTTAVVEEAPVVVAPPAPAAVQEQTTPAVVEAEVQQVEGVAVVAEEQATVVESTEQVEASNADVVAAEGEAKPKRGNADRQKKPRDENYVPREKKPRDENYVPREKKPRDENYVPREKKPRDENYVPREKKPRDENYVPREKKPREPREPREPHVEGQENLVATDAQGEQKAPRQPRGPRPNRPPRTGGDSNGDGWNVVKPQPGNHVDGYKPNKTFNKDRAPRDGQNKRPFNPENRKPFNKDEKYVPREKNVAAEQTTPVAVVQPAQTN